MVAYKLWRSEGLNSIRNSKPRETASLPARRLSELRTPPERFPTSMPTKELAFPVLPPALICILARCCVRNGQLLLQKFGEFPPHPARLTANSAKPYGPGLWQQQFSGMRSQPLLYTKKPSGPEIARKDFKVSLPVMKYPHPGEHHSSIYLLKRPSTRYSSEQLANRQPMNAQAVFRIMVPPIGHTRSKAFFEVSGITISVVFQDHIHAIVWLFGINLKVIQVEKLRHLQSQLLPTS